MNRYFEWAALYAKFAEGEAAPVDYLLHNAERAFRRARLAGLFRLAKRGRKASSAGAAAGGEVRLDDIHGLKPLPASLKNEWMRSFYRKSEEAEALPLVLSGDELFLAGDESKLLRLELFRAWGYSSVPARVVEAGLDFPLAGAGSGSPLPREEEYLEKCV